MLTETQLAYTGKLHRTTFDVFQDTATYFESVEELEVAKKGLESVLTESQFQELNQNWRKVDLSGEENDGNDLMIVLLAKSKVISSKSDFVAFSEFYTQVVKSVASNKSNVNHNASLLDNLKKELKDKNVLQLEKAISSMEMLENRFITLLLRPVLSLETCILEGKDIFEFEKIPFPEEYISPIKKAFEKIEVVQKNLQIALNELHYITEFDVLPKGYDKNFRIAHENHHTELQAVDRIFGQNLSLNSSILFWGGELIVGKYGVMEYLSFLNGGGFDNTNSYTKGIEALTRYKQIVEKEKARLEAVREEGDKSILNELGQLIFLSRAIDTAKNTLSVAKEQSAEAYHELIQAVHGVVKNSKY